MSNQSNQVTQSPGWTEFQERTLEEVKLKKLVDYTKAAQRARRHRIKDPGRQQYVPSPMGR